MTAYNTIADSDIDPESPITTTLMTRLRDNTLAIQEGTSPAPAIAMAALATYPFTQTDIDSSAIGQGQLKTTTGEVSTTGPTLTRLTLPGGSYGFYPQVKASVSSTSAEITAYISFPTGVADPASYVTRIMLANEDAARLSYAQQRYIQASPPYDLGDGEIPLFIFAKIDSQGNVIAVYEAPEAPWHYNGPTNIKADFYRSGKGYQKRKDSEEINSAMIAAGHSKGLTRASSKALSMLAYQDYHSAFNEAKDIEVEITQAIKQADMDLLPRPMEPIDGNTVVMLDPVSDLGSILFEMKKHDGFSVNELLHDGDLIVTDEVQRAGPQGVPVHGYKWR